MTFRKKCPEEQLFRSPGFASNYGLALGQCLVFSWLCLSALSNSRGGLEGLHGPFCFDMLEFHERFTYRTSDTRSPET